MIRVVLIDDQTLVRRGIRALLELAGDITIAAEAADGIEGAAVIRREIMVGDACYSQTISHIPEASRLRVYGNDITSRKQAEQKLQAQLGRLDRIDANRFFRAQRTSCAEQNQTHHRYYSKHISNLLSASQMQ